MLYHGSCHCRKVQFSVEAPTILEADRCNCSICKKGGLLHLIVPKSKFKILTGEDSLQTYTFGSGIAKHYFCKVCGCKPFYIPRSNPDGVDVNINCLDTPAKSINISEFDGQNWEQNAHVLAHKSIEK